VYAGGRDGPAWAACAAWRCDAGKMSTAAASRRGGQAIRRTNQRRDVMRTMGLRNRSFRRSSKNPAELYLVRTLCGIVSGRRLPFTGEWQSFFAAFASGAHLAACGRR